jgi:quercetin dioxygenase-like cupin family protein
MALPETTTKPRAPLLVAPGAGEALWFNNDLLIFKATGADTGGAFLLVEELARRGKVTPLHSHPAEDESFYVLEGEALLHLDGENQRLAAGAFVCVPRGVPHAYVITSEVARSLIVVTPGSGAMEAFFRAAAQPATERVLPDERPLDIAGIAAAAELTGSVTILGPPPFDHDAQ